MSDSHVTDEGTGPANLGVSLQQLKIINAVAFLTTVAINGLSASGLFSEYKVGEVADMHPTKIAPAGGAFSIWIVIYVLEALFILYGLFGHCIWSSTDTEDAMLLHGVGFWFTSACLFNSLWIITFVQGNEASLWCSSMLISCLLFSLCKMYHGSGCWVRRRPGGIAQRFVLTLVVDVHFSMYAGWVTVASICSISATLTSTGWSAPSGGAWAIVMLAVALVPNAWIAITRHDPVWGSVLAWASAWIAVANSGDTAVVAAALVVCSLVGVVSAVVAVRALIAAWNGRHSEDVVIASRLGGKDLDPEAVPMDCKDDSHGHTSDSGSHTLTT